MGSVDTRSLSSDSDSKFDEIDGKLSEELGVKLKVIATQNEKLPQNDRQQDGEEEENEEEEEFSFVCVNADGSSPVSADVIFQNGIITPSFPLFGQQLFFPDNEDSKTESSHAFWPPLRKVFVEESHYRGSESHEPEGPYCVWTGEAVEASREVCNKSNSTGFSKLWKFRELVPRSNSDGKDAFVFLKNPKHKSKNAEKNAKAAPEKAKKKKSTAAKNGSATAASAHEQHYVANRKVKEESKRKSYLPYRPDIVGIFTNVNGLSRNVHPI